MSFRNTKSPLKPTTPAKWQVPILRNQKGDISEWHRRRYERTNNNVLTKK